MPQASHYRPVPSRVVTLIRRLRELRYLVEPTSPTCALGIHRSKIQDFPSGIHEGFEWRIGKERGAGTLDELGDRLSSHAWEDIQIHWPNTDLRASGLIYPFSQFTEYSFCEIYFDLAKETIYRNSDAEQSFDVKTLCPCGGAMVDFESGWNHIFYSEWLPTRCHGCQQLIDYGQVVMNVLNNRTGASVAVRGGITYRFAVVIDCHKMHPVDGDSVADGFTSCVEEVLGCQTRVVQQFY